MATDEHLSRQRKNNRLMAVGLAGVVLLVLLGMIMAVGLEISVHRAKAQNPAIAGVTP